MTYSVRVVGNTEQAAVAKGRARRTEVDFTAAFHEVGPDDELEAVNSFLEELKKQGAFLSYGTGERDPLVYVNFRADEGPTFWPIAISPTQRKVILQLGLLASRPGYETESARQTLRDDISRAAGAELTGKLTGRPKFSTSVLLSEQRRHNLVAAVRAAVEQVRSTAIASAAD